MRFNKIKRLDGGFETTFKTAVFLFQKWIYRGCVKVTLF